MYFSLELPTKGRRIAVECTVAWNEIKGGMTQGNKQHLVPEEELIRR
jgi:hypothetical protein